MLYTLINICINTVSGRPRTIRDWDALSPEFIRTHQVTLKLFYYLYCLPYCNLCMEFEECP